MKPEKVKTAIYTEKSRTEGTVLYQLLNYQVDCKHKIILDSPNHDSTVERDYGTKSWLKAAKGIIKKWIGNVDVGKPIICSYEPGFKFYIDTAEEMIKNKTGKSMGIINNTYTFEKDGNCRKCEACNTVGVMLHRAGINVDEWQAYIGKKAEDEFFGKHPFTYKMRDQKERS